jgi:hypothetical protein
LGNIAENEMVCSAAILQKEMDTNAREQDGKEKEQKPG